MSRFFLVVLLLYALPHVVLYARLRPILRPHARIPALFAILSLMSTFFVGFSLQRWNSTIGRPILQIGFFWMAFIFWSFCAGLLVDAWNLLLRLIPAAHRPRRLDTHAQLRLISGLLILAFSWSAAEGRRVRLRHLVAPGLTASRPVRIALVSDLHLSPFGNRTAADRALTLLETAKPDLILSGGDLVDAPAAEIAEELARFAALKPPLGKYAVLGNHEFYTGLDLALAAHESAGFQMLRETRVEPLPGLVIAGVDDPAGTPMGGRARTNEGAALPEPTPGARTILLKHRPTLTSIATERADLQLSGHTHGGQLFPFNGLVRLMFRHLNGLHQVSERTRLYVSRGAGTWGPPLRLFAPPEVTLITVPAAD